MITVPASRFTNPVINSPLILFVWYPRSTKLHTGSFLRNTDESPYAY